MKCDIIIPIYNAYEALTECVSSVINSTDLKADGLILVNDSSSDEKIVPYLEKIKKDYSDLNITVIQNEENKGFVGTVNVGMRSSNNDVVLLNSDTVVSERWLEKLKKAAYSNKRIATVTPLSNSATLCSVPEPFVPNEIPSDITIDEYNALLETCFKGDYPELPTAHGFCVYIKRSAIEKVGYFDEETFGRGYGEENDFSYRCIEHGLKNVLCTDTIVYHKESQSFKSDKEALVNAHKNILTNRYPVIVANQDYWLRTYPIEYVGKTVRFNLGIKDRKNVLLLIHEWEDTVGGTTMHIIDIIKGLRDKYNFYVLYPSLNGYSIHAFFGELQEKIRLPYTVPKISSYTGYSDAYAKMLDDIIVNLDIDVMHVHHIIGHSFDAVDVAKKHNVKSIITLHDFYSLCPSINMLYCGEKYCMPLKEKDCAKCLKRSHKANSDIIGSWRSDFCEFLSKFDKIITPSDDAKEKVNDVYADLEIEAIEHGVTLNKTDYVPDDNGVFNIAFIGVMCIHKGGLVIRDIIKNCKDKNIKFHVFGSSELPELKRNRSNYIYHGRYKREELSKILMQNKINLIGFFQIWPETYSYTLNEAVASGIPVISFDMGAGAGRVKKHDLGWIVPNDASVSEISTAIKNIAYDKDGYRKKLESLNKYSIKSVADMAKEYAVIYGDSKRSEAPNRAKVSAYVKYCCEMAGDEEARKSLLHMLSSFKWRLISRFVIPPKVKEVTLNIYKKFKRFLGR